MRAKSTKISTSLLDRSRFQFQKCMENLEKKLDKFENCPLRPVSRGNPALIPTFSFLVYLTSGFAFLFYIVVI